jgi:hypothetical protein
VTQILLEIHQLSQVLGSTSSHHLIKDPVILGLHVIPIYPLRNIHGLVLGNDYRLIEVLLKSRVKSVVNARFILNKPWVLFSLFPHQVCLALLANFLPPIQI